MKSFFVNHLVVANLVVVAVFAACGKEGEIVVVGKDVTGVSLYTDTLVLKVDEVVELEETVFPATATDKTVTWNSSNDNVVKVDNGKIIAIATGTATITVATNNGNYTDTCVVIVKEPLPLFPGEPEMVFVQGGTFSMGYAGFSNGQITLSSFLIGIYPITQEQWIAVMGINPSDFQGLNMPVTGVTWSAANSFINALRHFTGKNYRLPTEAEWEYAARGGNRSQGYTYSGSNNVNDVAWYSENSDGSTKPVGSKAANELGIYDLSGNVWEWCSDFYANYTDTNKTNPRGPEEGYIHVIRGGSWYCHDASYCRVIFRAGSTPGIYGNGFGFQKVYAYISTNIPTATPAACD